MEMINKTNISNIKSNEICKDIFSNLNIVYTLKLIKYNKMLQKRLGITKEIFKNYSDFPKFGIYRYTTDDRGDDDDELIIFAVISWFFNLVSSLAIFLYSLIYAILLISLNGFDESNTKKNSGNEINTIEKLNKSLFGLVAFIPITIFLNIWFIYDIYKSTSYKGFLKLILRIFFIIVHALYEGLIIWKVILEYDIKIGKTKWFMRMDIAFLVLNFIFIIFLIGETFHIRILFDLSIEINYITTIYLNSINNIRISTIELPQYFDTQTKKEKKTLL